VLLLLLLLLSRSHQQTLAFCLRVRQASSSAQVCHSDRHRLRQDLVVLLFPMAALLPLLATALMSLLTIALLLVMAALTLLLLAMALMSLLTIALLLVMAALTLTLVDLVVMTSQHHLVGLLEPMTALLLPLLAMTLMPLLTIPLLLVLELVAMTSQHRLVVLLVPMTALLLPLLAMALMSLLTIPLLRVLELVAMTGQHHLRRRGSLALHCAQMAPVIPTVAAGILLCLLPAPVPAALALAPFSLPPVSPRCASRRLAVDREHRERPPATWMWTRARHGNDGA
jgi:hypothetical protein